MTKGLFLVGVRVSGLTLTATLQTFLPQCRAIGDLGVAEWLAFGTLSDTAPLWTGVQRSAFGTIPKPELMHTNSKLLFEKYAKPLFAPGFKVLEVGPDTVPSTLNQLTQNPSLIWHTLDIYDNPQLTYPNSQEYSFDIPDGQYDVVLSAQVIEHVKRPWLWFPEVARVTRPGGLVITINPVSWIYHEAPVDCWRIYPEGMKALYEDAALTVLMCRWESLELPEFRRHQPGISLDAHSPRRRRINKLLGKLGFPVERAYDTITIGRKTLSPAS